MSSRLFTAGVVLVAVLAALGNVVRAQTAPRPQPARQAVPAGAERTAESASAYEADPGEPDEVQAEGGASLGRVGWVLVIQAVRGPKGDLRPWDKESAWSKAWRVPGDAGGTRYVPVLGDAEDREHVRASDARHLGGLGFLASKYQAPAIAIVVREPDGVAVSGWRGGVASGWATAPMPAGAAVEDARAAAVRLIAGIFPARAGRDPEAAAERMRARVLAFRLAGESMRQYQIVVEGRGSPQALQRRIESVSGLSISEIMTTPNGFDVVLDDRSGSSEPVERRLTQAGLPTQAEGAR